MLLFPDMRKERHEAQEFVFASPCTYAEWFKLKGRCGFRWGDKQYLPYTLVKEGEERIAIICRSPDDSDDDCLVTAAYLRMVGEFTGMIYALPYQTDRLNNSIGSIIARTAGVDPKQVRHVEI